MKAWRSIADIYRIVYAKVNSDLRHYGLTPPQYSILRAVGRSETGSLPMNQIGKELIVTNANITVIVDNLEKRNCLKRIRGTKDRRVVWIELTPEGRRLWKKIVAVHRKKVAELMSGLPAQELEQLVANIAKIRDTILKSENEFSEKQIRHLQRITPPHAIEH